MNFYILDNDSKIIHLLSNIIENDFNNTVVGTASNPQQAYDDAMRLGIDIMFIDYAMPVMDGVQLIQKIQDSHHYPHFIMTAQAILPSVKTSAYQHGIDFFIEKPLNIAEVKSVIKLAAQNINMSNRLLQVLDLVSGAATNNNTVTISGKNKKKENAQSILRDEHGKKIIFQRIRRDIKTGLNNLAHMCMDYPENDIILEYANNLYEYKNVHNEISFLKGERTNGGQVSLKHFFNGLIQEIN